MNDDYPYKITSQDQNLSEVEYVQVSNEVKPVAWASTDDDGHVELHLLKQKAIATGLRVFPLYAAPTSPEEINEILTALTTGALVSHLVKCKSKIDNIDQAINKIHAAIKLLGKRL